MYSTRNRVNGAEARLLEQVIGILALQLNFPRHSKELSNPTTCFRLPLGSHIGDKESVKLLKLSITIKWIM